MKNLSLLALAGLATSAIASAQGPMLNEIYASHSGTDDMEFVELIGAAGFSLDGYMVLVVEGEGTGAGTLDRAWDLSGLSFTSNYFVLGDTAVVPNDFDLGASNALENGTETVYLVQTANPGALVGLVGTNLDPDGDLITDIPSLATIVDVVGIVDGGYVGGTEFIYDGAMPVGPDGSFLPGGIYRGGDFPNGWCTSDWLDFDVAANATQPRTPGAMNVDCSPATTLCDPANAHSGGVPAVLTASGTFTAADAFPVHLEITDGPAGEFGYSLISMTANDPGVLVSDGLICVNGAIARYNAVTAGNMGNPAIDSIGQFDAAGVMQNLAGTSGVGSGFDVPNVWPLPIGGVFQPGETAYFQTWFRDGVNSNFSNAVIVTFN